MALKMLAFTTWAHLWLLVSFLSTRMLRSFSDMMLSNQTAPILGRYVGLFLPRPGIGLSHCWTWWMCWTFICVQFSSILGSLWMKAHPSDVSATSLRFASAAYWQKVHRVSPSRLLMKMLNIIGPSAENHRMVEVWRFHLRPFSLLSSAHTAWSRVS